MRRMWHGGQQPLSLRVVSAVRATTLTGSDLTPPMLALATTLFDSESNYISSRLSRGLTLSWNTLPYFFAARRTVGHMACSSYLCFFRTVFRFRAFVFLEETRSVSETS